MPLYQYECEQCGHRFDSLKKLSERKLPEEQPCPECGEVGNVKQKVFTAQPWIDAHKIGIKKHDAGFNEVLSRIAEKAAGSNMKEKLSRNP